MPPRTAHHAQTNTHVYGEAGGSLRETAQAPARARGPRPDWRVIVGALVLGLVTDHLGLAVLGVGAYLLFWARGTGGRTSKRSRRERNRVGREGELAAARVLDRTPNAHVFHDLDLGGENADSVVLTREGLYCIEVKNYSRAEARPDGIYSHGQKRGQVTAQARRQAGKLGRDTRTKATPVIVLVQPSSRILSPSAEGVTVCALRDLARTLEELRRAAPVPLPDWQFEAALKRLQALTK